MYHHTEEGWIYHATLAPEGKLNPNCRFGFQCRFEGEQLYISAHRLGSGSKTWSGALFIFEQTEENHWKQKQRLRHPSQTFYAGYGLDWSLFAPDQLAVGALFDSAGRMLGSGSVITYLWEEESELWKHSGTIPSPDPESGRSGFGQQLLGDGEGTLLVFGAKGVGSIALPKNIRGAPVPTAAKSFRSKAHLYGVSERIGTLSERLMLLEPPSPELWVGRSISSKNHFIIAAPNTSSGKVEASGKVYLLPRAALHITP